MQPDLATLFGTAILTPRPSADQLSVLAAHQRALHEGRKLIITSPRCSVSHFYRAWQQHLDDVLRQHAAQLAQASVAQLIDGISVVAMSWCTDDLTISTEVLPGPYWSPEKTA